MKRKIPPGGFTLIELLVVLAIIAILVGLLMPDLRPVSGTRSVPVFAGL